jgi:hypothetical protein
MTRTEVRDGSSEDGLVELACIEFEVTEEDGELFDLIKKEDIEKEWVLDGSPNKKRKVNQRFLKLSARWLP